MSDKKVAIVTGGTRGIGAAISKKLKQDGFTVVANYARNHEAAEAFKKETKIEVESFDVADYKKTTAAIKHIEETHGDVAVLVNNAGITDDAFLHKMTPEQWSRVIETNLTSVFNTSHAVMAGMRGRGFGRVINISSINGQKGQFGQTNYSAAKAGIIGFTKALALEGARKKVTANVICPGYVETDMTAKISSDILTGIIGHIPVGRMGKPEEIASLVSYLASDDAAFVTGAVFSANGGQYM